MQTLLLLLLLKNCWIRPCESLRCKLLATPMRHSHHSAVCRIASILDLRYLDVTLLT